MTDDDPLVNSALDARFRAAHRALRELAPPKTVAVADDAYLPDIIEDLENLARVAQETAAAHVGPTFRWTGPQSTADPWASVILQVDLDSHFDDDPPDVSHVGEWENCALARAGSAYRSECDWDFSPGPAGIWLLFVAPYSSFGSSGQMHLSGTLAGFAILHDRDEDGEYESLAHLWTARAWRRRGVGTSLVRQARERFPVSRVENPATEGGRLLLEACASDLLEQST
ncbi:GNAT family N-acetyltransferase [Georgenia daeguensis]|uniref:N-acetyltransferase domain-containing protein n=1 Tax=Georgenia daeguensis TaxID=908355 RepID=A0ABP6USB9_9MICO